MIKGTRYLFSLCLSFMLFLANAQDSADGDKVIQQVFEMLSGEPEAVTDASGLLMNLAWEALAYLDASGAAGMEDLQEAVPDYYNFREEDLILKLINPENYNEYGVEISTPYRVKNNAEIILLDAKDGSIRDRWQILYLDENYLALDMGELRVFFTKTPEQE